MLDSRAARRSHSTGGRASILGLMRMPPTRQRKPVRRELEVHGSGAGPEPNFRDDDPSCLELVDTKRIDQPIELEMDESK